MRRGQIRKFNYFVLVTALLMPFQNCSTVRQDGNTGADGMIFKSYGVCQNSQIGIVSSIQVSKDRSSAYYTRKNCQDLSAMQSIDMSTVIFASNDKSFLSIAGRAYDQQVNSGGQRVTLTYCTAASATAIVWGMVGNGVISGTVSQSDGETTGSLTMQSAAANTYSSTLGQASQMQLSLNGTAGSLSYTIGSGSNVSLSNMSCASQSPAPIPADGSAAAPTGLPQDPSLLSNYALRAPWKVAGVDYRVGFAAGSTLKNPVTDPALAANASVTIDTANKQIVVHGNDVVLDGYDFTLNGGYSVSVTSGTNTTVSNSNVAYIQTAIGTSGLTVSNCVMNGTGQTSSSLITHLGTGTLTVTYNWFKNFKSHVVEDWTGGDVVYKYNLLEDGGTSGNFNYIQFGGGTYSSVVVDFNTTYQPYQSGGADEGFVIYSHGAPGTITGEVSYNTMIAVGSPGKIAMSALMHIGGGTQDPTTISASIHDNYMDYSAAYTAFYESINNDGHTTAAYSNNFDMNSGSLLTSDP